MPRVALSLEQKGRNKIKYLTEWIEGRMQSMGLKQEEVAKALNITQPALCTRLNPKTYKKNKNADPFKFGDLLILCSILDALPEEKERLLTL